MPKTAQIQTKFERMISVLTEQNSFMSDFENQIQEIYDDFTKWTEKALYEISISSSKKGRKRIIEAILENEEYDSSLSNNSSGQEDNKPQHSNGENITQNEQMVESMEHDRGKRVKRTASKLAEKMISQQVNLNIHEKLRRPDYVTKFEVQIKAEKLSLLPNNEIEKSKDETKIEFAVPKSVPRTKQKQLTKNDVPNLNNDVLNVVIKQEKDNDIEPTRKQRSRNVSKNKTQCGSKQRVSNHSDYEDDVQIELPKGVIHTVSDSEDEIEKNDENIPRAKKISVIDKSVHELSEKTELKNNNETGNEQSVYEDAQDQVSSSASSTLCMTKPCYVRLENVNCANQEANLTYCVSNESTNENTELENEKQPVDTEANVAINNTVVLHKEETENNHFSASPLKPINDCTFNLKDQDMKSSNKKVVKSENIEKPVMPARITRTKQRAIEAAATAALQSVEGKENLHKKDDASQNAKILKHHTPNVKNCDVLKLKLNSKLNNIVTNVDSFVPKPVSAIKTLKSDLREKREEDTRKKLEKEEEVQKKKEAIMLAKVEEQKKKREEKALRAQQIREQMEKERQMQAEKQEREKEEKMKQIQAEREAFKKELARKRALADKRAQENEERRRLQQEELSRQQRLQQEQEEAEKRNEAQRKREQEENEKRRLQEEYEQAKAKARAQKLVANKFKQLHKTKKDQHNDDTPIVKTKTVFDLDTDAESEDEENPKRSIPLWSKAPYRSHALEKQSKIPDKIICTLFGSKPTCIDLRVVFPNISESRLRRQSSAIWNTPPRYSLMPKDN